MLGTGRVLLAGGEDDINYTSTALLYNPAGAGTFSSSGSMATARRSHAASILGNGKVVVAGGSGTGAPSSAELYDPTAGTWSAFGTLVVGRMHQTETVLPSGRVDRHGSSSGAAILAAVAALAASRRRSASRKRARRASRS